MINYDFSSLLSTFGDCILDFSQPIILILYFEILAGVILFPFLLSFCYPNRSYNRGILCLLPLLTKRSSATGSRDGTILVEEALSYQFKESCFSLFFPLPRNSFSVLLGKVPKNYQ